jgi:hypothetical protein
MVYNVQDGHNVLGLIVKLTSKYAHYAICAGKGEKPPGQEGHFVTTGHKIPKHKLYLNIMNGNLSISYGGGTKRRRKIIVGDSNSCVTI